MRILFICTGNTCRSPMAEAILKNRNISDIEVKSAGVHAMDGMHASGHANTVLAENNIQHAHSSTYLTDLEINWATHILTMTASHKAVILQSFPNAHGKTYLLKEFAGEGTQDVIDPYGGSVEVYRETYKDLEKTIEKVIEKLTS